MLRIAFEEDITITNVVGNF
jgi:hypothetical protein